MKMIRPLSGRGKDIYYKYNNDRIEVKWGEMKFFIEKGIINEVLNDFFIDKEKWYPLGASMTDPIKGGLGEFLSIKRGLSPRHASVVASIMYDQKLVDYKMKRRIDLKRIID